MLPKVNRLTKKKEFENVFKKGKSSYNEIVGIKVVLKTVNSVRFGIVISNKVSKKATKRNRIRRQVREIFWLTLNKIKQGDYVLIARPAIVKKTYKEIESSIIKNLRKLKALKK